MTKSHQHHNHNNNNAEGNIKTAFFLNLFFTVIEFIGGALTNSMAILSDAVHDLGDSISLGLSWYFQNLSKKGSNQVYTYGYKRFSLMGAIINSLILLVGSVIILITAIPRLKNPQQPETEGMIWLAILGIIVNGAAILRLRRGKSLNEKVVSLHMLEDVLGWVAVLIGAIVMNFINLPVLDPILSIAIAGYVLFNIFKNMRESLRIILQGTPDAVDTDKIIKIISKIPDIQSIHDVHIWSTDGEFNIMTVHVVLHEAKDMNYLYVLKEDIRKKLAEYNIQHATIEFETINEDCILENCH
ncbi:MAG: cation diffusion facilitator family transporter [Dysgonamonadaceae bacterium]|nr:cation diffusion facilitator family transporter [Dysgonamonadaceae bacterium]MDD4398333.1 cation diffusion facilitator family transporter [Dysgonamonadaceae bacterium]